MGKRYLQKCAQHVGGEYVDADLDGNLHNGVVVFMITLVIDFLSVVAKASSEKS